MTLYATRLHTAEATATATVSSSNRAVIDWCDSSVRPWWDAVEVEADDSCTGPLIVAERDPERYARLADAVTGAPHSRVTYAGTSMLLNCGERRGDTVNAVAPGDGLAYQFERDLHLLTIYGCDVERLAFAAVRLARDAVRGVLLRAGWTLLHASAVSVDQRVTLMLGAEGTGRTSAALTLATHHGWDLVANDRVFVRPDRNGDGVRVLPWPATTALGLGLLDALDWFDLAGDQLAAGDLPHPAQDRRVTEAILTGRREPLWDGGRELKAQISPAQFPKWFGLGLERTGWVVGVMFPRVESGGLPAVVPDGRTVGEADFITEASETRYPDIFGFAGDAPGLKRDEQWREVIERLRLLPTHSVDLGHDLAANADVLAKLADV